MKPCPYRKEHEWEWDGAGQFWLCVHCYSKCTPREASEPGSPVTKAFSDGLRKAISDGSIIDVVQDDSEKPTPVEPMPTLARQLSGTWSYTRRGWVWRPQ